MNCTLIGLSRPKDSLAFCARAGPNSGDTNLRTGLPGDNLRRIKIKQIIKKRTIREERSRLQIIKKSLAGFIIY
jgi:hypothetical protein